MGRAIKSDAEGEWRLALLLAFPFQTSRAASRN
jgi:hypothetical protein